MVVLAVDQSTSATKAMIFDSCGQIISRADVPHRQMTNMRGWVEHDAEEIYRNTLVASSKAIQESGVDCRTVTAIGISNQRETAVCWDRSTGQAICPAIVWQCCRAKDVVDGLQDSAPEVRRITGLALSPYFSAAKFAWILRNIPSAAALLSQDRLCFGNIDAWLLFRMTGGQAFLTDYSNASRTQLLNLNTLDWDEGMLSLFGLKRSALPRICDSNHHFGETTLGGLLDRPVPVLAMMGDSQAALYANGCHAPHSAKATFGTGTSVMMNSGAERQHISNAGIVESLAWGIDAKVTYVLEGNINSSGSMLHWLQNNLRIIATLEETSDLARDAGSANGVYFIPAFTGLGAPYWRSDVRAMLCGMSASTQKEHVVRAALEAITYQIRDIAEEMRVCSGAPLRELCADGGAVRNSFLMEFTADLVGCRLKISETEELSAAGVAYLAALTAGLADHATLFSNDRHRVLEPAMPEDRRAELYGGWKKAVSMLLRSDPS